MIFADSACFSKWGYLKLYGANINASELSMIGSFGVYKNIWELYKSLHLNYEQLTVISHSLQSRKNIEALTGPI